MVKVGRRTKYKPQYCKEIIAFFSGEHTVKRDVTHTNTRGDEWTRTEFEANTFPTIDGFAAKIGVDDDTLVEWSKRHKFFSAAYTRAKQLQRDFLIDNGLAKRFDGNFAKFVAINCCGMKEKSEHALMGADGGPLQVQVVDSYKADSDVKQG